MQSPIFRAFFDQLGANAQPMPINEVFSALETRAIDAQENPLSIIASQRFNEVQPYLSLTEHIYTAYVLLISQKTWNALNEAQRAALKQAAAAARDYQRELARRANQDKLAELQALGMQVNQLSEAERQRFVEQAEQLTARQGDAIGADFIAAWQAELQRLRGGR
ncbi:2,3-diketo-L-gulonate-binding periplasmic protein YiaO precursor [compost metagenome]